MLGNNLYVSSVITVASALVSSLNLASVSSIMTVDVHEVVWFPDVLWLLIMRLLVIVMLFLGDEVTNLGVVILAERRPPLIPRPV